MASPVFVGSPPSTGGGAPGTAEVIVANEAAASAIAGLVDGQQVFVKSHRSWWRFNSNSPAPIVPHVAIASASPGPSPRLLRTAYAAPEWRESITDVYIDPANTTGIANDENHAIFSAPQVGNARQPLLTWQELFRRWGHKNLINTGDLVNLTFQIHVLSSEPGGSAASDPWDIDFVSFIDTYPRLIGEAAVTTLGPIALTAFTAQNPAVPAPGGTPCSIQIGATVWGPFIGKRIRRVSDGSVAYILKDLGGGVARISQPQLTNEATFAASPTNVNWAAGNNVVVENLTDVNAGRFHFGFVSSAFGFAGQFNFLDVNFMNVSGSDQEISLYVEDNNSVAVAYQCTFARTLDMDQSVIANGCGSRSPLLSRSLGYGAWFGGAVIAPAFPIGGFLAGRSKQFFLFGQLDFFAYSQGGCISFATPCTAGVFSVWDAPVQVQDNPGGHAVLVGGAPNTSASSCELAIRSSNIVFGSGSAGRGVRVGPGSKVSQYLVLPNVTGAGGDFQLADDTSAIPQYDTPSYVFTRVVDAQVVGNATDVALQAATSGNLVIAANTIALVAGKTYKLRAKLRGDTTTLGETLDFAWVDAGTNAELIANTGRGQISNVATNAAESLGEAEIVYKPAANQTVKLRCINAVIGGNTTLRQITGTVEVESLFEFPIACSWVNLAATVAAGGFGGNAHNPRQDAHIMQAAAT
jgi:hypothetical protein